MANLWFRLYTKIMTDPIIEFMSFEDQRHYVWLLCLKSDGVLDKEYPTPEMLDKVVARKLGLQGEAFENMKERLMATGLIDINWQPVSWDNLQYKSDSSKERTRKYREKLAKSGTKKSETSPKRHSAVTVTPQETDTDTEADTESEQNKNILVNDADKTNPDFGFDAWWKIYPKKTGRAAALKAWLKHKLCYQAQSLIDTLTEQVKREYQFKDKQYIKNGSTYLNGEHWLDEIIDIKPDKNNPPPISEKDFGDGSPTGDLSWMQ